MDDLMSKFEEVILHAISAESRLEEEFKKCSLQVDDHVAQCISTGTPVQNKKRPKRLDSITDGGHHHDREHETSTASNSSTVSQSNRRKNSTHEQQHQTHSQTLPQEPAKVPDLLESSHTRPARTARLKAAQHLKEPTLNFKMRQPSINVKQERISVEVRKDHVEPMELDMENDANVLNGVAPLETVKEGEKRKSHDEGFGSNNEKDKEAEEAPPSREMSIMVIPQPIPKVEVLSDDEAIGKMPPPAVPPPKTKTRTKKADKSKAKNSHVFPLPIKKEKDLDEMSSSSAVSSAESSLSTSSVKTSERIRKKKASTQAIDMGKVHIKTEKLSNDGRSKTSKSKTADKASINTSPAASEKSVYEDAIDGDANLRPMYVALDKVNVGSEPEKNQTFAIEKNGTFVVPASNGTFVVPSPAGGAANGTFQVKSPENGANITFDIRQLPVAGNNTFVMENKFTDKQQLAQVNCSIMTEDNSHVEEPSPDVKPKLKAKPSVPKKPSTTVKPIQKKNHALFSMQSPIKTRIEAFEKAAIYSPMHTRTAKVTTPSQMVRMPPKTSTTPLASQRFPSSAKASSIQTTPTAQNSLSQMGKGMSSSASKLAHLQKKPTLASTTITKSYSLSREPSVERLGTLSGATSSSSLALDEKKKNREEKQRLAQQQREQMEKEKREHAERLMREKEEKMRKLVQEKEDKLRAKQVQKAKKMEEFEKRRHLEELNQRQLAEQKREELARLEQLQRAEREHEILKLNQAKENYEIKLHKQMYQQKLQQQQKLQHQQLLLLKQKGASGVPLTEAATKTAYFNFDMIATDDSTDDESVGANKKTKRPPLAPWTTKENRLQPMRIQSEVPIKVIDQLFSVAPMTPDLREIFPTIDARKLKRNSSAVWRTPPRYSQMPKY